MHPNNEMKMETLEIFLSWSGQRSYQLADTLRKWLPKVNNLFKPWMSSESISKGDRWTAELTGALDRCNAGIICVTAENKYEPWLLFESGALAKKKYGEDQSNSGAKVCTYLLDLAPADLDGPLTTFQHTRIEKEDTKKMIWALGEHGKCNLLQQETFSENYDLLWSQFDSQVKQIPNDATAAPQRRNPEDMVREILELTRGISQRIAATNRQEVEAKKLLAALFPQPQSLPGLLAHIIPELASTVQPSAESSLSSGVSANADVVSSSSRSTSSAKGAPPTSSSISSSSSPSSPQPSTTESASSSPSREENDE